MRSSQSLLQRYCLLVLWLGLGCMVSFAQNIVGKWSGVLNIPGSPLPLVLNISQSSGKYQATLDSPVQNAFGQKVDTVHLQSKQLRIVCLPWQLTLDLELKEEGKLEGEFQQRGSKLSITLTRSLSEMYVRDEAVQTSKLSSGIVEQDYIHDLGSLKIGFTLAQPAEQRYRKPLLAVIVGGSGPIARDGHINQSPKVKVYSDLSDSLIRLGYSVLRYDKRGTGKSTGTLSLSTHQELAQDLSGIVTYARQLLPKYKVVLLGHSEGGVVGAMSISQGLKVDGLGLIAAPVSPLSEVTRLQRLDRKKELEVLMNAAWGNIEKKEDISTADMAKVKNAWSDCFSSMWAYQETPHQWLNDKTLSLEQVRGKIDEYFAQSPSIMSKLQQECSSLPGTDSLHSEMITDDQLRDRTYHAFKKEVVPYGLSLVRLNPMDYYKGIKVPVFAIQGDLDSQVFPDEVQLLERNGITSAISRLPKVNHLLQSAQDRSITDYLKVRSGIDASVVRALDTHLRKILK